MTDREKMKALALPMMDALVRFARVPLRFGPRVDDACKPSRECVNEYLSLLVRHEIDPDAVPLAADLAFEHFRDFPMPADFLKVARIAQEDNRAKRQAEKGAAQKVAQAKPLSEAEKAEFDRLREDTRKRFAIGPEHLQRAARAGEKPKGGMVVHRGSSRHDLTPREIGGDE